MNKRCGFTLNKDPSTLRVGMLVKSDYAMEHRTVVRRLTSIRPAPGECGSGFLATADSGDAAGVEAITGGPGHPPGVDAAWFIPVPDQPPMGYWTDAELAAVLMAHLWRWMDAGGKSEGRTLDAALLEAARDLLAAPLPAGGSVDLCPNTEDLLREARRRILSRPVRTNEVP